MMPSGRCSFNVSSTLILPLEIIPAAAKQDRTPRSGDSLDKAGQLLGEIGITDIVEGDPDRVGA